MHACSTRLHDAFSRFSSAKPDMLIPAERIHVRELQIQILVPCRKHHLFLDKADRSADWARTICPPRTFVNLYVSHKKKRGPEQETPPHAPNRGGSNAPLRIDRDI